VAVDAHTDFRMWDERRCSRWHRWVMVGEAVAIDRGSIRQEPNGTSMFVLATTPQASKQRAQTAVAGSAPSARRKPLNDAVAALSAKTYVPPSSQRLGLFLSDSCLPAVQTRGPLPFAAASAS
jgi:hypothetical protein